MNGATVGDWDVTNGMLRVRLLDPVASETSFVVQGDTAHAARRRRAGAAVRVPAAERETGGVAVDVVGAGEIAERTTRGLEPADPSELGEIVAGPRVAVDDRVSSAAARRKRAAIAGRHRRPLHPAGGADRQRRRGALSRAGI